jgi:sensor c-di-GMP phosphodiesterase-like protein
MWRELFLGVAPSSVWAASTVLFSMCVAGAFGLAYVRGVEVAEARAVELANGVRETVEAIEGQINAVVQESTRSEHSAPCSDAQMARMRAAQVRHSYVAAIGQLDAQGTRLQCSTFGSAAEGLWIEPAMQGLGQHRALHPHMVVPLVGAVAYLVAVERGVAVFVHSEVAAMVLSSLRDAALGAYREPDGLVMFSRGSYDLGIIRTLERSGRSAAFDGRTLFGISRSDMTGSIAFVTFPAARVERTIREARVMLVPLGTLLGVAVSILWGLFLRERSSMVAALRRAIDTDSVYMAYQPIMDLRTGTCTGAEALVRWTRNGHLVPPDQFVVTAERGAIMPLLTSRVVALVARDMAELLRKHPAFHVSINLSAQDLHAGNSEQLLADLLSVTGLPATSFWVEITESELLEAKVAQTVEKIRAMGIRVAVDDFGTGYSSLGVLDRLKVDLLKIDKRFVQSVSETGQASEVALAIIGLARKLNLEMVAEGVETQQQADFLVRHGVQFGQGWLYGRPGPAQRLSTMLARESAGR